MLSFFEINAFIPGPVNPAAARQPDNYSISGYTRKWKGGYGTPDSERHRVAIQSVEVSADARRVRLNVRQLREKFVYEVTANSPLSDGKPLWPATGHYTMNKIPSAD